MQLRDYQESAIDRLEEAVGAGVRRNILYGPTGCGKTEQAIGLAQRHVERGEKVLFAADLITLADQSAARFAAAGIRTGIARGEDTRDLDAPVVVTSPQTLAARLRSGKMRPLLDEATCFIVDEAHTRHGATERVVMGLRDDQHAVGLTATPQVKGLGKVWEGLVVATTTRELFDRGLLVRPRYRRPEAKAVVDMRGVQVDRRKGDYRDSDVAERAARIHTELVPEYRAMLDHYWPGRVTAPKTMVFTATVEEAEAVARLYTEMGLGEFRALSYLQSTGHKRSQIQQFHDGRVRGLASVAVLAKGFDAPDAEVLIDLRPNAKTNIAAYCQKIGRIFRAAPGKEFCVILDHAQNLETFRDKVADLFVNGPPPLCRGRKKGNGTRPGAGGGGEVEPEEAEDGVLVEDEIDLSGPVQDPNDPWFDICAVCVAKGYNKRWARHAYRDYTGGKDPRGKKFAPRRGGASAAVREWQAERAREYAIRKQREAGLKASVEAQVTSWHQRQQEAIRWNQATQAELW